METKKSNKANLESRKNFFFQLGLTISLLLIFAAFEWRTYTNEGTYLKDPIQISDNDMIEITQPEKIEPEPPKPQFMEMKVTDEDIDQENIEIEELEDFKPKEYVYERPDLTEDTDETNSDEPFIIVQKMPEFPGGDAAMYDFLRKNVKYPSTAVDIGITGTVYVSFIVERDGSLSNIRILKGIGGGCDEEAIRVIRMMPDWEPGRQREIPVRVLFNLPIRFTLKAQ